MAFKQVLMVGISFFFILGLADHFLGNRLGLGEEFMTSMGFVGRVILNVAGIICLSPVLSTLLTPIVTPVFTALGADPSLFAASLLSADCGGYSLSMSMTLDPAVGRWAGAIVSPHVGAAISFSIPVGLGCIDQKDNRVFALGALSGLAACPFGCFVGGLMCGLTPAVILKNLVPTLIVSLIIILGLIFFRAGTTKVFVVFGKCLTFVIYIGLSAAAITRLTGWTIIPGMAPISDAFLITGTIGITMAGIQVMTTLISRVFRRPLDFIGRKAGINSVAILSIINALASIMPGCMALGRMNERGKIIFAAFICASANILGAHLGFIGTTVPELLAPMIVGKLLSGCLAVLIASLLAGKKTDEELSLPETTIS